LIAGPSAYCDWRGKALAADDVQPLAGRRIVVTRAPEQAEELIRRLENAGAQVLLLPMVRFAALDDTSELNSVIAGLGEFDWVIFTSANAVRFFLVRCRELGRWALLGRLQIAVVGSATRAALEAEGLAPAFVPREFSGTAVADEFGPQLTGKKVLLPRSDRAGEELPDALRAAGAAVAEVVAYRTAEPELIDDAIVDALRRGEADAITFFSPSAFRNFERAAGVDVARQIGERVSFAAVGPTTAAAIRAAGVKVAVEASSATNEALAEALESYFARGRAETGRSR
jgi:uroporphyrinogen III methyltransferase/synthase